MANIQLTYGAATAVIRTKGAQIVSFKGNDGRELMWQAHLAVWGNHAPILFPVCGMPEDEKVIIDDVIYPMASPVILNLRSSRLAMTSWS